MFAQVAELVDALASGASVRMDVEVQVLSWAPFYGPVRITLYLPNRYSINASLRVILNREPSLYGAFLRLIFMTAIAPYRLNLLAKHVKRAKH